MGTGATAIPVPLKWPLPLRPVAVEAHLCSATIGTVIKTVLGEVVPLENPLFDLDVDGLTQSNKAWLQMQFLQFYLEST